VNSFFRSFVLSFLFFGGGGSIQVPGSNLSQVAQGAKNSNVRASSFYLSSISLRYPIIVAFTINGEVP